MTLLFAVAFTQPMNFSLTHCTVERVCRLLLLYDYPYKDIHINTVV